MEGATDKLVCPCPFRARVKDTDKEDQAKSRLIFLVRGTLHSILCPDSKVSLDVPQRFWAGAPVDLSLPAPYVAAPFRRNGSYLSAGGTVGDESRYAPDNAIIANFG